MGKTIGWIQLVIGIILGIFAIFSLIAAGSEGLIRDVDILYTLTAIFAILTSIPNLSKKKK